MLTPGGGGHVSATDKKSLDGGVLGGAVDVAPPNVSLLLNLG